MSFQPGKYYILYGNPPRALQVMDHKHGPHVGLEGVVEPPPITDIDENTSAWWFQKSVGTGYEIKPQGIDGLYLTASFTEHWKLGLSRDPTIWDLTIQGEDHDGSKLGFLTCHIPGYPTRYLEDPGIGTESTPDLRTEPTGSPPWKFVFLSGGEVSKSVALQALCIANEQLAIKDSEIKDKDRRLADASSQLEEINRQLADKDYQLAEIKKLNDRLAGTVNKLMEKAREVDEISKELAGLRPEGTSVKE
ncbi:hypothetical protein RhiLY_10445 [Ceratobasidium sp. AG-Ba]|nr:hypothetical protein RhiLY_10445 [Ceratobasidium sp. AG-Ba]